MTRLTSEMWVSAYLRRLRLKDIPAFITAKGDPTAGNVMVKLNTLDGRASVYQRTFGIDGNRKWTVLVDGDDTEVEKSLSKQRSFDRDIWIVEVEDRKGRHLLEEPGLSD